MFRNHRQWMALFLVVSMEWWIASGCTHSSVQTASTPVIADEKLQLKEDLHSAIKAAGVSQSRTQNQFESGVSSFCEGYYMTVCEGPQCQACSQECRMKALKWRLQQLKDMGNQNLTVEALKKYRLTATEVFKPYAKSICQVPADRWMSRVAPDDCEMRLLAELEEKALADSLRRGPSKRGGCAQIPLPPPRP